MRILIVDDELVGRTKLETILETIGDCTAVEDGSAGLDAFEQAWENLTPFDVICLDIQMPGLDGRDVLRRIRKVEESMNLDERAKTMVVMVTSMSDQSSVLSYLDAGCNDYIVKPFDPVTVIEKISNLVKRRTTL